MSSGVTAHFNPGVSGWILVGLGSSIGFAACALRWMRVAQREHYLAGSVSRFALRWWRSSPANVAVIVVAAAAVAACPWFGWAALGCVAVYLIGPLGLGLKGRTSPLRWTRRSTTLASVGGCVAALGGCAAAAFGNLRWFLPVFALEVVAIPVIVDFACLITAPYEKLAAGKYVRAATEKLNRIKPKIVAITGSYGKTSTKNYVAHLLGSTFQVVASPASFNNTAGLSRAVNEKLSLGTEIFVAEMGTYGPGEIAAMCSWMSPDIAVITAVGPVHLERMKSEDNILRAKAEICRSAPIVVLNIDDDRVATLAAELQGQGKQVIGASASSLGVEVDDPSVSPSNLACAIGVAKALGVGDDLIAIRISTLPTVDNRRTSYVSDAGFTVIDDTYNSNPAGARAALAMLTSVGGALGKRVVVTPGMVELGRRQFEENREFAVRAAQVATHLVMVGRTNHRALKRGVLEAGGPAIPVEAADRDEAVAWVRKNLGPGDTVLYENDLPDHFP